MMVGSRGLEKAGLVFPAGFEPVLPPPEGGSCITYLRPLIYGNVEILASNSRPVGTQSAQCWCGAQHRRAARPCVQRHAQRTPSQPGASTYLPARLQCSQRRGIALLGPYPT